MVAGAAAVGRSGFGYFLRSSVSSSGSSATRLGASRRLRAHPALRALRAALELPERIAAADDRRLVLFFDEFQEITSGLYGMPGVVTRQMRAIFQRSGHVSVLFAGSIEHVMRDLFAPSDRALSKFGAFHELEPITFEQWREGLRARLALDHCTITDDALDRLIELGEGHPRATMLIAQQTHRAAAQERARHIDGALAAAGFAYAMRADRARHEQTLERIRSISRHAQRVAVAAKLYQGLAPQNASRALHGLHDAGLIECTDRRGRWRIIDPLLRHYLTALPLEGYRAKARAGESAADLRKVDALGARSLQVPRLGSCSGRPERSWTRRHQPLPPSMQKWPFVVQPHVGRCC